MASLQNFMGKIASENANFRNLSAGWDE